MPLPPGSGKKINFEIKDGGANGEASELWTTSFTDDFAGWHQVEIPFSDFVYRTDFQPVGGIDHVLGLTQMWGYAFTLPTGAPGQFALDGVELYGKPDPALTAGVITDAGVYPVAEGGTAKVKVTLATTGSVPVEEPVTVDYSTEGGTAEPGKDYRAVAGSLTFPAGSASGAYRVIEVPTLKDKAGESAETIPLKLTVTGAKAPVETPQVVINAHGLPLSRLPAAGEEAGRGPAVPDVARREGRPDDPGRAQRAHRPGRHRDLRPRFAALRRRFGADAQHT